MEGFIYKKATNDDLDKIIEIGKLIDDFELEDSKKFWDYEILNNCIDNEDSGLIVCSYQEDNLAGFGIVLYNPIFKRATISDIFVLPKYRNFGIGKELYKLIESDAQKRNMNSIQIVTEFNNTSVIGFFENNGYDKTNNNSLLTLKLK